MDNIELGDDEALDAVNDSMADHVPASEELELQVKQQAKIQERRKLILGKLNESGAMDAIKRKRAERRKKSED